MYRQYVCVHFSCDSVRFGQECGRRRRKKIDSTPMEMCSDEQMIKSAFIISTMMSIELRYKRVNIVSLSCSIVVTRAHFSSFLAVFRLKYILLPFFVVILQQMLSSTENESYDMLYKMISKCSKSRERETMNLCSVFCVVRNEEQQ